MSIKVGCGAWCFTRAYRPPFEKGIEAAGELKFDGIELLCFDESDMDEYYTPGRIRKLVKLYRSYDLSLSQFVIYASMVEGLASLNKQKKQKSIVVFEKSCKLARSLGAKIISTVSHWPEGLKAPIPYPPLYIYTWVPGIDRFNPKLRFDLPKNFSWKETWENYMDSMRTCANIAKENGLSLALESHPLVIISSTDAYLRLFDEVDSPTLGANLDTGYPLTLREYLPITVHKLKGKIFHLHARDGDGLLCYNLPPGLGIIDWDSVIEALNEVGYDGFLSLELSNYEEPEKYAKFSKEYLKSILKKYI